MKKALLVLFTLLVTFVASAQIDFQGVYIGYKQEEVSKPINIIGGNYWMWSFNVKSGYCVGVIVVPAPYDKNEKEPRFISEGELLNLADAVNKSYGIFLEFDKEKNLFLGFDDDGLAYEIAIVNVKEGYNGSYLYQVTLRILNIELHKLWKAESKDNSGKEYN